MTMWLWQDDFGYRRYSKEVSDFRAEKAVSVLYCASHSLKSNRFLISLYAIFHSDTEAGEHDPNQIQIDVNGTTLVSFPSFVQPMTSSWISSMYPLACSHLSWALPLSSPPNSLNS